MSGYRDRSNYDPNAYERPGRPLRPFNWVQWCGVALIGLGTIYAIAFLLGEAGVIPKLLARSPQPFATFPLIGMLLVNSRRQPGSGELRSPSRRTLIAIAVALAAFAIALAAVLYFQGAK